MSKIILREKSSDSSIIVDAVGQLLLLSIIRLCKEAFRAYKKVDSELCLPGQVVTFASR